LKKPFTLVSLLMFCLLGNYSCRQKSINDTKNIKLVKQFNLHDFKSVGQLTFHNTGLNFGNYTTAIGIVDTMLIVCNNRDSNLLEVIGLRSMRPLAKYIKRGKESDQSLTISEIIPTTDKNIIWVYDMIIGKFIEINIQELLANPQGYHSKIYFTVKNNCRGIKSPSWVFSNRFVSCSYRLRKPRYIEFDSASNIVQAIGELPEPISNWPPENETGPFGLYSSCYSALLKKNPARNQVVIAYTTADRLELFEGNRLKKILRGPGQAYPVYSFRNDNGINMPTNTNATVMTNVALGVTSKYFFSLYSGRDNFGFSGQDILAFDWNGKLVKRFLLGKSGIWFCIKEDSTEMMKLYLIDEKTGNLLQSSVTMNRNRL